MAKNMNEYVSLCVLAYKRPDRLHECLNSLFESTSYPYELIVNLDGADYENNDYLYTLYKRGKISKLILNNGLNRGVGRSMANCIGIAEGEYICKIDTDLTFKKGWLEMGVKILVGNSVAEAVSFFNYRHYDPNDKRFNIVSATDNCLLVDDFVSSIYLFHRKHLEKGGWENDDGFHQKLRPLALTPEDMVENHGFGVTKSVYVTGTEDHPVKAKTYDEPLIFNA